MSKSIEELEAALEAPSSGLDDLAHANPKRRRDALDRVMALARRSPAVGRLVLARLDAEDNPFVLSRALRVAGATCAGGDGTAAGAAIARFLRHADARVVANAVEGLTALADRAHADAVTGLLAHAVPRVRANAIVHLAGREGFDAGAAVAAMTGARDAGAQRSGLWAAHQVAESHPEAGSVTALVRPALAARDPEVLDRARTVLSACAARGDASARELLAALEGGKRSERLELRVPPLTRRALAWLADSVFLGALACAALAASSALGDPSSRALHLRAQLIMLAYSLLFFMRDGLGGGRGLFKRWYGLRVVDLELSTGCGLVKSMIRQATFYLPLVNACEVAWAALDPEGCRIVDRLLGTMVVDEHPREVSRLDRAVLVVLGVLWVAGTIALFFWALAGRLGLVENGIAP